MQTLLGVPLDVILAISAGGVFLTAAALLLATLRQPLLLRLALRNSRRRPAQALLIALGLTLSTVIVSAAFNTGDTITHTVRSLVASGLGRADEVVLALPRDQRRSPGQYLTALLNGTLLTGLGRYFPEAQAERLQAGLAGDERIAGLAPAIGEQVTVVNLDDKSPPGQVSLLALPPEYPAVFGSLVRTTGEPTSLAEVGPDELLANAEAATLLGAQDGTRLELRTRDGVFSLRLRSVVRTGDLGGAQPTLYLPLTRYQELTGHAGEINQVLVANRGDRASSVQLSGRVSQALRAVLVDRAAAARLFDLLRGESTRSEIDGLARTLDGRARDKLERLAQTLRAAEPSDEFVSLATDPDVERRLYPLAARLAFSRGTRVGWLDLSPLRVLEVKQASQDQADRWGGALTSTFLVLGLFSLATGALLVFLIFTTLAAERRGELGVLRALGARRRDVTAAFLLEGALYDLAASALGVLLGVLVTLAITAAGDNALQAYGLRLEPHLEPRSLAVSFCLGLLVTFVSIGYSAWHVSRLSVVAAIRNLPEPPVQLRRWRHAAPALLVAGGAASIWLGTARELALPQALGVGGIVLGLALGARWLLERLGVGTGLRDRLAYSCCGAGLLAYWLLPITWQPPLVARPVPRSVDLFFLAGLSMVLGAVWVLIYNLPLLTGPLVGAVASLRSTRLALRTAVANPLQHRFRTGLIVAMFALVIFSMVVASVLLTATHRAYDDPEALAGGFDVRATITPPAEVMDLPAALDGATAVRAADFSAVGRLAMRPGQVLELGPGTRRWRPYSLEEVDAGFVAGLRAPLAARADGYDSDAAVWQAVLDQPGLAVVGGPAVGSRQTDPAIATAFRFSGLFQGQTRFSPVDLWVRDDRGGRAAPLRVIGVLDPRVSFASGLFASAATFEASAAPAPLSVSYYLKAAPGADPTALASGLNVSFGDRGLQATALGEDVRRIQNVRTLLNQLLQGFFGVGLLAGLAALGVLSTRAVVERRQQVGMLRALGFRRATVRLSLLLEISLLALLGIGLGVGLGLGLAERLVEYLGGQFPEITFGVPWQQIGLVCLGAYLLALLLTALPLWQIGRIQPAETLKYE